VTLPDLFGIELLTTEPDFAEARMELRPDFMAPNGYLHAAAVVALADTICGMGCFASFPEGVTGFTTIELKTNFLRSAGTNDTLLAEARMSHGGRTTQVWDATVRRESDGKDLALFRCTQYLLQG
jgi:1,4-dihydroxy-2-naphthoyl-CoA hydrolase